jgi:beta-galactosidase
MTSARRPKKIAYGGDLSPEQWPEHTWAKDLDMLRSAGIDTATINVFGWSRMQPD